MAQRIPVHKDGKPCYDIVLKHSFQELGTEIEKLAAGEKKICIVTDSNVGPLYRKEVEKQLVPHCKSVDFIELPAGEEYKNLDTVKTVYEFLIKKCYDRGDYLAALGGGVIGDLCGYAAATYLRGISFIQIPTTLLSQVDSSVGGKTGVDFDAYKNMVGAFHMPQLVYSNTAALLTLPKEQLVSGMGEVIKHGLIKDYAYYTWLKAHADEIIGLNLDICEEMVEWSDRIKRDVVERDPTEQGDRALLNFGHTLGHAIEKLMEFKLPHGHCVAFGCLLASYISYKRGLLTQTELTEIRDTFQSFGFAASTGDLKLDPAQVIRATKNDKKMDGTSIKFILLDGIGNAFVDRSVTEQEMEEALLWLRGGSI